MLDRLPAPAAAEPAAIYHRFRALAILGNKDAARAALGGGRVAALPAVRRHVHPAERGEPGDGRLRVLPRRGTGRPRAADRPHAPPRRVLRAEAKMQCRPAGGFVPTAAKGPAAGRAAGTAPAGPAGRSAAGSWSASNRPPPRVRRAAVRRQMRPLSSRARPRPGLRGRLRNRRRVRRRRVRVGRVRRRRVRNRRRGGGGLRLRLAEPSAEQPRAARTGPGVVVQVRLLPRRRSYGRYLTDMPGDLNVGRERARWPTPGGLRRRDYISDAASAQDRRASPGRSSRRTTP